ncbi:MAG: tetratricopeptide repeat protein [Bacteroidaceae bacterium]|nr:tetratricopeptide repeat protein [Bacteroidaceae bacterium]
MNIRIKPTYRHTLAILALMLIVLLPACTTTKNTGWTRFYQSMTTRYNVYFNAEQNYIEQLKQQQDKYEDNFTDLLYVLPAEAYANPKDPQPQGSFDRTIEKCELAIQKHSIKSKPKRKPGQRNNAKYKEFMRREEYNPFMHNVWLLMGKAQYNKGDFLGASSTFMYIAQHFSWLPQTVAEARIWQARSYLALGWTYEAEDVLYKANNDSLPPSLTDEFASVNASYLIRNKEYRKAIPYLETAIKGESSRSQRARLNFLLGQLYAREGKSQEAYQAYKRVVNLNPLYRTQFNARIKMSEVYAGNDIEKEVKSLRRMATKGANKDYQDQIYYAIGNLYLAHQDTLNAIDNYKTAVAKSTRNGIEKAVCQVTLGGLHFGRREYVDAQPCYSEAIPLLKEDYPDYKLLTRRSTVLDKLVVYAQNVELQDSLQMLAGMSEEDRNAAIQKIIDDLIKKEKEEAEAQAREEYLAKNEGAGKDLMQGGANKPTTNIMNSDGSWYFYNQTLVNAGKTEFQKIWGSRKLEDDWRRRNKSGFSLSDFATGGDTDSETTTDGEATADAGSDASAEPVDSVALANAEDPHKIEYYLKQIPLTPEDIAASNEIIADGLYNMGIILKNDLEDYEAASATFDDLERRFPDNKYRLDTYYNRYLMHMRNDEREQAEVYRGKILTTFGESEYATALSDPNFLEKRRTAAAKQDSIYQSTYAAYLDNNNAVVHSNVAHVRKEYPLSDIMHKFIFLDAMAYVGDKEFDNFKSNVEELLKKYPQADVSEYAGNILKGISKGRTVAGGNVRGMIWNTRLGNDSTAVADSTQQFVHEPNSEHYFVFAYNNREVSGNQLLFEVARMNFSHFLVKDFDLEINTFNEISLLVVKGFNNFDELIHYRSVMTQESDFVIPEGARPVMISTANYNLLLQGRTLDEYFEFFSNQYNPDSDEEPDDTMGR